MILNLKTEKEKWLIFDFTHTDPYPDPPTHNTDFTFEEPYLQAE